MEQLDSMILNTTLPTIAPSLQVGPLSVKAAVTAYLISLALRLQVNGCMADRFSTWRVFISAAALYELASVICRASADVLALVVACAAGYGSDDDDACEATDGMTGVCQFTAAVEFHRLCYQVRYLR